MRRHVAALKARTCPRTPKLVLLKDPSSGKRFSHELAAWAGALAIRTWPLYCHSRYISEIAALNSPLRLDFFQESLFGCAGEFGWDLRAWAVLANHYHFVAASPSHPGTLRKFLGKLHMQTAKQLNRWDNKPGRKVWFQFWESNITFERSYLARLNYVHYNPARHGIVPLAEKYKWCSASWFAENAPPAFVNTVKSFKIDRVNVPDDF